MKVLLDEHLPPALRAELPGHDVFTVRYMRWDGLKNGELIAEAAASGFEVLLTMDANIPYQQNPWKLPLSVVVVTADVNDMAHLRPLVPEILKTLATLTPRSVAFVK